MSSTLVSSDDSPDTPIREGLHVLDSAESIAFLLRHTDKLRSEDTAEDATCMAALARELGGLELALELAAAYICQEQIAFQQYLILWQQSRSKLMVHHSIQAAGEHHCSLFVTLQMSLTRLPQSAQQLLQVLSWLAPDPFPTQHLALLIPIAEPITNLTRLTKFHLTSLTPDEQHFSVHPALQEITRLQQTLPPSPSLPRRIFQKITSLLRIKTHPQHLVVALKWIHHAFTRDYNDFRTWPILNPLVPHVIACATHADRAGISKPTQILLNNAGLLLINQDQHQKAEPLILRFLLISEKTLGKNHPEVATGLSNLSIIYQSTGRMAEAEPPMRRALNILERKFGTNHPKLTIHLNNLAFLLQRCNRLDEAETLLRRALAISETSLGSYHSSLPPYLNNLAQLLQLTNRLDEAESLKRRALAIDEVSLGADHPTVATELSSLALLFFETNRFEEADPLLRRVLAIDEASCGSHHPKVATDLSNLARLLQETKRFEEAEPLMRRALVINETSLGPDHPDLARDFNNLAMLLRDTNRRDEAVTLLQRALDIYEQLHGLEHPDTQHVLRGMEKLHKLQGNTPRDSLQPPSP